MNNQITIEKLDFEHLVMNNTKIAGVLPYIEGVIGSKFHLRCLSDKSVITSIDVTTYDKVNLNDDITAKDMAVLDAVSTIYLLGAKYFTLDQVIQIYSGRRCIDITDGMRRRIEDSITKLRHTSVEIDCTDEFLERERERIRKSNVEMSKCIEQEFLNHMETSRYIYEGNLLYLECVKSSAVYYSCNGKTSNKQIVYHFVNDLPPILLQYAQKVSQLRTIPIEYIYTNNNLDLSIVISRYLISRVFTMQYLRKNRKPYVNKISLSRYDRETQYYKGVMPYAGIKEEKNATWRKKKQRVCEIVEAQLNLLIEKKVIMGFAPYYSKRSLNSISGYEIFLGNVSAEGYLKSVTEV